VINGPKEIMNKMKKKFPDYIKNNADVLTKYSKNERVKTMKNKLDKIFHSKKGNSQTIHL
jgi:hypothetical protein